MRILIAAAIAVPLAISACGDAQQDDSAAPEAPPADAPPATAEGAILHVLEENPEFSTLAGLVPAAGLAGTLGEAGAFTLFAPTDAAFAKLPAAEREALARPDGRAALRRTLAYHVVPGRVTTDDLVARAEAGDGAVVLVTLQGGTLTLREDDGQWRITGGSGAASTIAMPDVAAANGVVHAIDTILEVN